MLGRLEKYSSNQFCKLLLLCPGNIRVAKYCDERICVCVSGGDHRRLRWISCTTDLPDQRIRDQRIATLDYCAPLYKYSYLLTAVARQCSAGEIFQ